MNPGKAIEIALAQSIRDNAEIGSSVIIRCWQSLRADGSWTPLKDRDFPVIDIRCQPQMPDESAESTAICECAILCGTKVDDDKDHALVSSLYESVQGAIDKLFSGFRGNTTNAPIYTTFSAKVEEVLGTTDAALFAIGGLTMGAPTAPFNDESVNMIGLAVRVHFSRSDF